MDQQVKWQNLPPRGLLVAFRDTGGLQLDWPKFHSFACKWNASFGVKA
ncbi:MAG: hypothetical protein ACI84K_000918, partial [Pseudohongiellaceae bacterium]